MSDAARTAVVTWPTCGSALLRAFGDRVICDACAGMLIREPDFTNAIHELDGGTEPLAVSGERPSASRCPRCAGSTRCRLDMGRFEVGAELLRAMACGFHNP